jgi:hypothetical protein
MDKEGKGLNGSWGLEDGQEAMNVMASVKMWLGLSGVCMTNDHGE